MKNVTSPNPFDALIGREGEEMINYNKNFTMKLASCNV
jgi:hypothetical protein